MLFNSIEYLVFFILVYLVYWQLPQRHRKTVLFLASLLFYASWSWLFLLHFLAIILLNYPLYLAIYRHHSRKALVAAILLNFINLSFFKYFYFFVSNLLVLLPANLAQSLNQAVQNDVPEIILPLAISFYTFQIVAFQVDAWRRQLESESSLFDFTLFIMFFPQLIAGPIMRHNELLPQLNTVKTIQKVDMERALALIASGIVKKVLMADFLSGMIFTVSGNPEQYHASMIVLSTWFFALMVYLDFSAYTDLARGSAFLLGFSIPVNFRGPFFQLSFAEHWQRWHITLSQWLRDYLYFSLGGSRHGAFRLYAGLTVTFVLGGLWHGAGWGFVIWGLLNGLYLSIERFIYASGWIRQPTRWARHRDEASSHWRRRTIYNVLKAFAYFNMIAFAGIFFFAGLHFDQAFDIIKAIFVNWESDARLYPLTGHHLIVIVSFLVLHYLEYMDYKPVFSWRQRIQDHLYWIYPVGATGLMVLLAFFAKGDQPFVYFQF